ncbi:DUF817 domain-containing protein [Pseudogracilibacillus auburnensis]|uniref:Uncharacterized membrane protein YoaT (DUF817 family) n=1 Tax=Pseudogracilibacillus auburnensis TaxID=1494959 RepID=A0A2V3WD92_9BACI|nr:DUF817 domain-containing protein [Pseudogracilibacillus auburnensis]MBO1001951.1 DUF817 domain-containing protein [Pseudogracilibacillus auburnensis]PXW90175.1 uncharacterized membrane protein YoaT (DUF817 family) [Pseudogracilibacillus auburnensis]
MKQLVYFGIEQAKACLFPVTIFLTLAITRMIDIPFIARYDFILLICLVTQVLMVIFKVETWDEVKVICVFHIIGLSLEIYKVHMGSWSYPESAYSKVFGVPLYSGFMYASVASYMCQAWRRLNLKLEHFPPNWLVFLLSIGIYFNFYTHHYIVDVRWILKLATFIIFFKTFVYFTVNEREYKMPLSLSFLLIGFFIWIAENIATFFGAWRYPNQQAHWELVHIGKISSWFLLVIISFLIVALLKHFKESRSPHPINKMGTNKIS